MDTDAVSEFLGSDFLFLSAAAGLLLVAHSAMIALLRRALFRQRRNADAKSVARPGQLAGKGDGETAPPLPAYGSAGSNLGLHDLAHRSRISRLGEMSAAIAHEIRQPLTAIVLTGQAVQRRLANPLDDRLELDEMLDDIVKAGKHAGEVIERLQAMTRREPVPFREIDVNGFVADALRLCHGDIALRDVTPVVRLDEDLPEVRGDSTQLIQVVGNLIRNACDAMVDSPPGQRELTVRTYLSPGEEVCIAVSDTGLGLSPAVLEKLFQPFQTAKPGGIGLGLALCRSIASAHRGKITGANNPTARGAIFVLTLPAAGAARGEEIESNETPHDHLCCR